jgi:hypothetical protein
VRPGREVLSPSYKLSSHWDRSTVRVDGALLVAKLESFLVAVGDDNCSAKGGDRVQGALVGATYAAQREDNLTLSQTWTSSPEGMLNRLLMMGGREGSCFSSLSM